MLYTALVFEPYELQFVKNHPINDKINFLYKIVNVKLSMTFFKVIAQKKK